MSERPATPETSPQFRRALRRWQCLLARGCDPARAEAELVAYLVALRPGLPRVLAQEQAAAIAASGQDGPRRQARPPRALLLALVRPAEPEG